MPLWLLLLILTAGVKINFMGIFIISFMLRISVSQ